MRYATPTLEARRTLPAEFAPHSPQSRWADSLSPTLRGNTLAQGQIYDPYSTRQVNGATVRTAYVNNQMPLTAMDPVALAIQKLMPAANKPGIVNNYLVPTYSRFTHTTNLSFKFDQNLSSKIKIQRLLFADSQPFALSERTAAATERC